MKKLNTKEIHQVAGGRCFEHYEADVPLNYLPIVAEHIKKLNRREFNPTVMLQALSDAGLDTTTVNLNVKVACH